MEILFKINTPYKYELNIRGYTFKSARINTDQGNRNAQGFKGV